jgi:hypothetical protein
MEKLYKIKDTFGKFVTLKKCSKAFLNVIKEPEPEVMVNKSHPENIKLKSSAVSRNQMIDN